MRPATTPTTGNLSDNFRVMKFPANESAEVSDSHASSGDETRALFRVPAYHSPHSRPAAPDAGGAGNAVGRPRRAR